MARPRARRTDDLAPVWKALADPTRRAILDLLRERPRTTGELAEAFPSSRFAVMKHLAVLVRARLVVVRREGRVRWNRLNAVPLQRVYERWVRPYEGHWAEGLVRLKHQLESETRTGGTLVMAKAVSKEPKAKAKEAARVVEYELEVAIEAPRERVWKALVEETALWWRKDFLMSPGAKAFVIEPRVGGRMFEDAGDGAGLLWATVIGVQPGRSLQTLGHLFPQFGGPSTNMMCIELASKGKTTTLRLSEAAHGRVSDETAASLTEGWTALFGEGGLKTYVEKAARRR